MASSLEKLVDATDKSDLRLTQKEFGDQTELILRKGDYPYEYFDSMEIFNETQLPPIDKFYSKLSDESIIQKDYEHAQKVWQGFNCKTVGNYHDLYLKTEGVVGWCDGPGKTSSAGASYNFNNSRARAYCACSRCGWGGLDIFILIYPFSSFSLSVGDGSI